MPLFQFVAVVIRLEKTHEVAAIPSLIGLAVLMVNCLDYVYGLIRNLEKIKVRYEIHVIYYTILMIFILLENKKVVQYIFAISPGVTVSKADPKGELPTPNPPACKL